MSVVEVLLENAYRDTQLLISNDEKEDNFSIPRDVDYVLIAKDAEKAELVTSFINDNRYGSASFKEIEGEYRILVVVNMPSTQNLICSVSGLMKYGFLFSVRVLHVTQRHVAPTETGKRNPYFIARIC